MEGLIHNSKALDVTRPRPYQLVVPASMHCKQDKKRKLHNRFIRRDKATDKDISQTSVPRSDKVTDLGGAFFSFNTEGRCSQSTAR